MEVESEENITTPLSSARTATSSADDIEAYTVDMVEGDTNSTGNEEEPQTEEENSTTKTVERDPGSTNDNKDVAVDVTEANVTEGVTDAGHEKFMTAPLKRFFTKLSIPLMVSLFVNSLYGIVDSIIIGHTLGNSGLGALAVFYPVELSFCYGAGILVGVGAETLMSASLGRHDYIECRRIMAYFIIFSVFIALIIPLIFFPWLSTCLRVLGATDELLPQAKGYATVVLSTQIGYSLSYGMSLVFTAFNMTVISFLCNVAMCGINAGVDCILLIAFDKPLWGAAAATGTATVGMGLIMIGIFIGVQRQRKKKQKEGHKSVPIVYPDFRLLRPFDIKVIGRIASLGVGLASAELFYSIVSMIANVQISRLTKRRHPDPALASDVIAGLMASYSGAMRLQNFNYNPEIAVEQAVVAVVGYNITQKTVYCYKRILKTCVFGLWYGFAISLFFSILFLALTPQFTQLFGITDVDMGGIPLPVEYKKTTVFYLILCVSCFCFPIYFSGVLRQAEQKKALAVVLLLSHTVLMQIPLMAALPFAFNSVLGVWLTMPISHLIAFAFGLIPYVQSLRMYKRLSEDKQSS